MINYYLYETKKDRKKQTSWTPRKCWSQCQESEVCWWAVGALNWQPAASPSSRAITTLAVPWGLRPSSKWRPSLNTGIELTDWREAGRWSSRGHDRNFARPYKLACECSRQRVGVGRDWRSWDGVTHIVCSQNRLDYHILYVPLYFFCVSSLLNYRDDKL